MGRDGVIDARAKAVNKQAQRLIGEHLDEWWISLEAKGDSVKRVTMAIGRANRMVADCGFATLANVEPSRVHAITRQKQDTGQLRGRSTAICRQSSDSPDGRSRKAGWQ
jgi:hypothetical protein